MTIKYRGKKLQKITQELFFIQSNGPVRKDTGGIKVTQKDKQNRYFLNIKIGIKGKKFLLL